MPIGALPQEILSDILTRAALANEAEGPHYSFGLSQAPVPLEEPPKLTKYVRGPLSTESLRWDATESIRQVCARWREWALGYNLEAVFERRWRGAERWANLPHQRHQYGLYELIDRPSGLYVYRDPFGSLKHTDRVFGGAPDMARHVRRLWFNGFYTAETDRLILSIVSHCRHLEYLSAPWTILRRASGADWVDLLNRGTGQGTPLHSLELQAVCLPRDQADALEQDRTPNPLEDARVSFGSLRRLKIFGNTLHKPISDADLSLIARTATGLECLDITNLSTISVAGMLALVKASRHTLQVLEHSPRSDDGFYHPYPGHLPTDEHICNFLRHLPQMRDLSLSIPYVCADIFADPAVKWAGELQIRTTDLCCTRNGPINNKTGGKDVSSRVPHLRALLSAARDLIATRRRVRAVGGLNVEIFFAGCIFLPDKRLVHGDFTLAEIASQGDWPTFKQASTLGPYGQTGTYGKEEGFWAAVEEEEYFRAVEMGWLQL
ncbi:hypothetical protein M433DRAFT_69549 [Acidomyces richmondensis BFW]|nr:MAG: hypothetical protein FE78DRAFT_145965 [Acidomyces sp. 'richmondensis']KYG44375.1 hypothetical protein M433DRAFT_69549 [Acidomyces richmondensis BFW]